MRKIYLIALICFVCILSMLIYYFNLPNSLEKNYEVKIQEKTEEFLKENPNANESYARDVAIHDLAIEEKDYKLCEKIKTEWLKEDCLNYFKVSR